MRRERELQARRFLISLQRYFGFFLFMGVILTINMLLFFRMLTEELPISLGQEQVVTAAKLTFLNVLFISLLCTAVDIWRRHRMLNRPVKKIVDAAERIMQGNLDIRIEKERTLDPDDGFNRIIDYLNQMAKELSGMETLRTDFIANVSHELKTPLTVIQNYATMLGQPDLTEEQRREYTKIIADATRRMASMITNILKLNKLENQQIYPLAQTYDLGEQLCECLLAFEDLWEQKRLDIHTDIQEGVMVTADPELLELAWNNLFSNAIKFTEPGGKVSLVLTADEERISVQVADTGCGISPETGRHIFEKFYQGDTSHAARGNGLGLALVKRVVDIAEGTITVQSEVGKGSCFTVLLDRKEQAGKGPNTLPGGRNTSKITGGRQR